MATVTCSELNVLLSEGKAVVIDVMTPEDYTACHIAGAKNACIYEVVFLDKMQECVPDQGCPIVVYDVSGTTKAAEMARERLAEAGYRDISTLQGGLDAWRAAGLAVEAAEGGFLPEPSIQDGLYRVDAERSSLEWIGRNFNNRHLGRIAITAGNLQIRNGHPSEGSLTLDMESITNLDLQDQSWREVLINHLKSDDFFSVKKFPTARFNLGGWIPQPGGNREASLGLATGKLTIRDVTRTVSFPAAISPQADGSIKAHALLDFDRTLWNVNYGSAKLFERLGMHLVHDFITVELFVVAVR
ncbi:YceI family protein [Geomonas sp.]|uniref:YceI family protein n=1 Tax=Geomonas sp. TaxID=2651584 RepID=UPI002B464EEA|nr:YceI family protein [Geomonas sp.]HJV34982.1 YceI family protein [Geomonas sp.]